MRNLLLLVSLIFFSTPIFAKDTVSVEEAYAWIPHQRTVFDFEKSKIPMKERVYLSDLFKIVDEAIVEKVDMQKWLMTSRKEGRKADDYTDIHRQLEYMIVPESLEGVHKQIVLAVEEQNAFLTQWERMFKDNPPKFHSNELVQRSSKRLKNAYHFLKQRYPDEIKNNQQAFFDYLCALDFI